MFSDEDALQWLWTRIYQDAEVSFTKGYTSNDPLPAEWAHKQGDEIKNLLDIDPNDVVFYVGGYPDSFKVRPGHSFFLIQM